MNLTLPHVDLSPPAARPLRLGWLQPLSLKRLAVLLFALRVVTLGLHHFWGKTEVRKRIWAAIRVEGEPLAYTGTGRELLTGFLIVFGLVLLPASLLSFASLAYFGQQSAGYAVSSAVMYAAFYLLLGIGTYRAQRYRLSRTVWRGIRGSVEGSSWRYGWTHFWTGLLIPLTLGWIIPWRAIKLQGLITNDMRFGDRPFTFDAPAARLYGRFLVLWIGVGVTGIGLALFLGVIGGRATQLTLDPNNPNLVRLVAGMYVAFALAYLLYAILSAWYRAGQMRLFAAGTHLGGLTFRSTITTGGLIWLAVSNFLINISTLWMLYPVTQARSARYYVEHLAIDGEIALASVRAGSGPDSTRGEGLAQAFDVDAF